MSSAFTLEIRDDRLAILTFDSPDRSVNVFDRDALDELERLLAEIRLRKDLGGLLLRSGKSGRFIAGADVEGIRDVTDPAEAERAARLGHRLFGAWESLPFPTFAAVQGTCLGGGTELSLASTWRVISDHDDVRIGLPEIRLGILPGWGGCVRLPRTVGVADALDIILAGKAISGRRAFEIGLADALLPDADFDRLAVDFALERLGRPRSRSRRDLKRLLLERNPLGRKVVFDQARRKILAKTGGHYPAPLRAIEVVRIGLEDGPGAGFDAEARAIGELATSAVCKNLMHLFHLMEGAKKPAEGEGEPHPIERVAVLGAGVMGGGIAHLVASKAGIPVRLKDIRDEALADGMAHAAKLFGQQVERRRLSKADARRKMALIRPTLEYTGFAGVDLAIEAVIEHLGIKQQVFAETDEVLDEHATLASNTSSLQVSEIAARVKDASRTAGMHFFHPVHRMPLVEIVLGESTSPETAGTIAAFTRKLGKTPVLVRDTPGFLVNRLLMVTLAEALWLLDEGHRIEDIDRAMTDWGMPLGPFALTDEVGFDVAAKVAQILSEAYGDRIRFPDWLDQLATEDRLGAKTQSGFYRYVKGRREDPDPEIYGILGVEPRIDDPDSSSLVDRLVLPMVNEAARCLEEKVVACPGDLDLAMILGTGFPPFRGGLCRWADSRGLQGIQDRLIEMASEIDARLSPSEALKNQGLAFYGE